MYVGMYVSTCFRFTYSTLRAHSLYKYNNLKKIKANVWRTNQSSKSKVIARFFTPNIHMLI